MCVDLVELPMHAFDVIIAWTDFIVVMLVWIVVVEGCEILFP